MATGMPHLASPPRIAESVEPNRNMILVALAAAILFVVATRWPVARVEPFEYDEFSFLDQSAAHWFPMHHTLFMTFGRVLGDLCGDRYRGFIVLDMLTSAGALASVWWMLRSLVRPAPAAAAALLLGVGPLFWGYGAMAANYTAIVLVGAFLLGVAYRGQSCPKPWHPYAAAVVLALGTAYRPDIGTLWLAVFVLILWQHRWKRAALAGLLFTILNLAWLAAMLYDTGGWAHYRAVSAEYAYQCGYLNSVWHLGVIDAPVRYSVKLGMALVWTLGPALLFVPGGCAQLRRLENGGYLALVMAVAALPALGSHLLVQFGSPGWCFHYVPALIILAALGVSRTPLGWPAFSWSSAFGRNSRRTRRLKAELQQISSGPQSPYRVPGDRVTGRLIAMAAVLATLFWFYPTNFDRPGWRGSFDLAFCRFTRIGLTMPVLHRAPGYWRTANSRHPDGTPGRSPAEPRSGEG
jgi:hypothetical protein